MLSECLIYLWPTVVQYFSGDGIKQHAKNLVDPSAIPYVGLLFTGYRALHAKSRQTSMENVRQGEKEKDDNSELTAMLASMSTNAKVHVATCAADVGLSVSTSVVPVVDWIPGLSAGLASTVGSVGASVAGTTIGVGTNVVIKKTVEETVTAASNSAARKRGELEEDDARKKVVSSWGVTKAFISYLGYPATDDVVYSQWERSRLNLKILFGAAPEADLYTMKPKTGLLRSIESDQMKGVDEVEVPLLQLLFRVYDCWDGSYYDMLAGIGRGISSTIVPGSVVNQEYLEDARKAMPSVWNSKLRIGLSSNVRLATKNERKAAINCLTNFAMHQSSVAMLLGDQTASQSSVRSLIKVLVRYMMANGQVWVCLEDASSCGESDEVPGDLPVFTKLGSVVRAVALWEPAEYQQIDLSSAFLSVKAATVASSILCLRDHFKDLEKSRKKHWNHFPRRFAVLHWIGWNNDDAMETLLRNVTAHGHEICLFQRFAWDQGHIEESLRHCGFSEIEDPADEGHETSLIIAYSNKETVPTVEELLNAEKEMRKQLEAERLEKEALATQ